MDKQAFESDELVRDAVIRNIEIVGEASYNIRSIIQTSPAHMQSSLGAVHMGCAMHWHMATTPSISISSGIPC